MTVGYVSHLMSYGIFVEISPGIVGLVPNSVSPFFVTFNCNKLFVMMLYIFFSSEIE